MKGLDTLIKLHKRELDELRRSIVALETQKAQLLALSAKLQDDLKREIQQAGKQPEMAMFFGDFAKRIQNRQAEIAQEVKKLDMQIAKVGEQVAAAFAEVKKFEIAKANIEERERKEENRKETIMLDEVASQQHERKQKDTL